jgi:hypothetical protein
MLEQTSVIRERWCGQLTEEPIKSMIFQDRLVSRKRRKSTLFPGQDYGGRHSDGLQTAVYRRMRFDTEETLLSYMFNYNDKAITRPKQGNEENLVTGLFVRPPVKQQTDSQLQQMQTLKQQVSAIWPNQFNSQVSDIYLIHMILAADINGDDTKCVRMQDPDTPGRGAFDNLETYLQHTGDPDQLEERNIKAYQLFGYETIVKDPALGSGTFMQLYISVPGTQECDAIPLEKFIDIVEYREHTTTSLVVSIMDALDDRMYLLNRGVYL